MRNNFVLIFLAIPLAVTGCAHRVAYGPPPPPPPAEYSTVAQQGYHDGIDAARRDIRAGIPPDVRRHPRFRKPPVGPAYIADYRQGFETGYNAMLRGGSAPPPPPGY